MASLLNALTSLKSYHLLAWGSLLGTQLYQTFVNTKLCYLYLPRAQFMSLQRHVFPTYFAAATALAVATAVTYPAGSVAGLVEDRTELGLLTATIGMSALNLFVYGPKTLGAMKTRTHTETRDGLQLGSSSELPKDKLTEEMYKAKRGFSRNHAMSIHLNLIGVITNVVYGILLSSKMTV